MEYRLYLITISFMKYFPLPIELKFCTPSTEVSFLDNVVNFNFINVDLHCIIIQVHNERIVKTIYKKFNTFIPTELLQTF